MIVNNMILIRVAQANMQQLFASTQITVSVKEVGDDPSFRLLTITLDGKKKDQAEVQLEMRDGKVIGIQLNANQVTDVTIDLVRTAKAISKKLEELRNIKTVYYYDDNYLISDFREIGIDSDDGRRDLLINNNKIYSLVKCRKNRVITEPLTEAELINLIHIVADSKHSELDVRDAIVHTFVDYDEYEWEEE
jgi:hypothetical protein